MADPIVEPDRWFRRRPGLGPPRLANLTLVPSIAIVLDSASLPGAPNLSGLFGVALLVPLVLVWIAWAIAWRRTRRPESEPASRGSARWFLIAPAAIALATAALLVNGPLQLRFAQSRSDFDRVATARLEDSSASIPDRIGTYDIREVEHDGTRLSFWVDGAGSSLFGLAGFVYTPDGLRCDWEYTCQIVQPMGGGWYEVQVSF